MALGLLVGWLSGVVTGLLGVAVTGGWYEYCVPSEREITQQVLAAGWEPFPGRCISRLSRAGQMPVPEREFVLGNDPELEFVDDDPLSPATLSLAISSSSTW